MKYVVTVDNEYLKNWNVQTFTDSREVAEYITENMDESVYDEMLDECYNEIDICGLKYSPSIALYRTDPVAYECGKNDYYDSLAKDIKYDIDRMDINESETFYGYKVTVED